MPRLGICCWLGNSIYQLVSKFVLRLLEKPSIVNTQLKQAGVSDGWRRNISEASPPHFPSSSLCAAPPHQHPCPPPASPLNINASGRLDNNVTGN